MMKAYHVIGIMSGTSCDGLDIAYCKFWKKNNSWRFKLLNSIHYVTPLWSDLKIIFQKTAEEITLLDTKLGQVIGDKINQFIKTHSIDANSIDFIASHGHTVFHAPAKGYTLQIGNGNQIKAITKIKTIYDFRSMDVALGGQGAPLVPVVDELLFSEYDYCLNLGGIANISFNENGIRKAKDICYVGIILNRLANQLNLEYDDKGAIAKNNNIDNILLKQLIALDFNDTSLGIEQYLEKVVPLLKQPKQTDRIIKSQLTTCVEYAAIKIGAEINQHSSVFITGGGAYNDYLIERIKHHSNDISIVIPQKEIIDYKEAIAFGFLGVLKMENKANCLASVTGAKRDNIGGVIV